MMQPLLYLQIIYSLSTVITVFTVCNRIEGPEQTEMLQNVASHLGLHCLPLIQQFLDTTLGSKLYLFNF